MHIMPPCIIEKSRNARVPSLTGTTQHRLQKKVSEVSHVLCVVLQHDDIWTTGNHAQARLWPEQCGCRLAGDLGTGTTVLCHDTEKPSQV